MYFRASLLMVALVTLVQTDEFPEKKSALAYECVEPESGADLPPVIMLHTIAHSKKTWKCVYKKISSATGRRVCIIDLRDHGESFWSNTFTVRALVNDLKIFMDIHNMPTAALVGHSLGGRITMKFALEHPDRVEKAVVEDVGPHVPDELVDQDVRDFKLLVESEKAVPPNANSATARREMLRYIHKVAPGTDPEGVCKQKMPVVFRYGAWHWQTHFEVLAKYLDVDRRNATLGEIRGNYYRPVLFIYSIDSPLKVVDQIYDIQKIFRRAKFVGLEGSESFIHCKYRSKFLSEVISFLS